jgi:predicted nucleotidyltransferase
MIGHKKIQGVHINQEELLEQIRQVVREVEADAEIIFYGSRSRGDVLSESDCDGMG